MVPRHLGGLNNGTAIAFQRKHEEGSSRRRGFAPTGNVVSNPSQEGIMELSVKRTGYKKKQILLHK